MFFKSQDLHATTNVRHEISMSSNWNRQTETRGFRTLKRQEQRIILRNCETRVRNNNGHRQSPKKNKSVQLIFQALEERGQTERKSGRQSKATKSRKWKCRQTQTRTFCRGTGGNRDQDSWSIRVQIISFSSIFEFIFWKNKNINALVIIWGCLIANGVHVINTSVRTSGSFHLKTSFVWKINHTDVQM